MIELLITSIVVSLVSKSLKFLVELLFSWLLGRYLIKGDVVKFCPFVILIMFEATV